MQIQKENDMKHLRPFGRSFPWLAILILTCLPLQAWQGHEAEAYSFAFHNFDSSDDLPWSSTPDWSLYRDTFLAIPPEHDPLSSLFEYAFFEIIYKEEIGKSGNCFGIALLSLLLNKKGAHLSVCGAPGNHTGDLHGHYVDKTGGMGLPDLFLGQADDALGYYEEETFPAGSNLFPDAEFPLGTRPAFVNVDGDGDWDLFVAQSDGTVRYFENIGSSLSPTFAERVNELHPLQITGAGPLTLEFADLDGDRDPDAFVADGNGQIRYFKNVGGATNPEFEEQVGNDNPLDLIQVTGQAVLRLIDSDADGDLDAYVGKADGSLDYFENQAGQFVSQTGDANPADNVSVDSNAAPFFTDFNGDGVLDLFVGSGTGAIGYFLNTGSANNPQFTWQNPGANPMSGIQVAGEAVPVLIDINDQDNDDQEERMGPTDPLVRRTITRLHGHQVNMASLQYFADYFLSGKSQNALHAYQDFLDNQAKGVGTLLSITRNFEGDGAHVIIPYRAETKPASNHSALITTEEGRFTVEITGGADVFLGHHEDTTITIPGAGDGGDLVAKIVRIVDNNTVVLSKKANQTVNHALSHWNVPEKHLLYVHDSNFPYQNEVMRPVYDYNANVVMIDPVTGDWRYRKNHLSNVWPQSPNAHISIVPETVAAPMDRTPVAMGIDAVSLATQIVIHNEGASLVQVTDGAGKRMFIPGTRKLDLNPKTGLRQVVPLLRFDGDTSGKRQVYLLWGKQPETLNFEVVGPKGYELDIASHRQRVQLKASPIQGKDTLVVKHREKSTEILEADPETTYHLTMTHLTRPGQEAETLSLQQMTVGGSLRVAKNRTEKGFTIVPEEGRASYQLHTKTQTKQGIEKETFGFLSQKAGTVERTHQKTPRK